MLRRKLYTGFVFLAMVMVAPAVLGQQGGVPFIADMPDDEAAEFLDLRNRVLGEINQDYSDFQESGYTTPLAAEEEEPYK